MKLVNKNDRLQVATEIKLKKTTDKIKVITNEVNYIITDKITNCH